MNTEPTKSILRNLSEVKRKAVPLIDEAVIRARLLTNDRTLPLVIEPVGKEIDLLAWATANRGLIEEYLLKYGAVLFRGFPLKSMTDFGRFANATAGELIQYNERTSPRSQLGGNIYTSTDYPASQSIFPHNEHSYSDNWPMRLFFCCVTPAQQGGETPIADSRNVYRRISPRTRERFIEKDWMYVRNFGDGFGLPWQTVFQTNERAVVEQYCREHNIEVEWKDNHRLRTRQVRPAVARHPHTGEAVWFNHAAFFHVSTLDETIRGVLLAEFNREDLPNNTYYGDGSEIEPEVMEELREAYRQEAVAFAWQPWDVLLIDNMLVSHSRNPYKGQRKVLVAMAQLMKRTDLQT